MTKQVDPNMIVNISMPFAVVTYLKGLVAQRPIAEAEAVHGLLRHAEQQAQLQAIALTGNDKPAEDAPQSEDAPENADAEQTEEA